MSNGTHNTPPEQYNVFTIHDGRDLAGELFTAEVTDRGVHLDHNFAEGGLFIKHEDFADLNDFRKEILEEIDQEDV
jgi:hypothetical protein